MNGTIYNHSKGVTYYEEHLDGNHGSGSGGDVQRSFLR